MKILIASDAFKESLSAKGVSEALASGIRRVLPETEIRIIPMADGGEGTVESVIDATRGRWIALEVRDPLMRPVRSRYGITGDGLTAVIEMAAASGLELLDPAERNPWVTSSFGTGQLILDALERGCTRIIVGIGGSATNDGGMGMARALGVRFTGAGGTDLGEGGGFLASLERIHLEGLHPGIGRTGILVACDVSNPLTGPEGASFTYAPQKGADAVMVSQLDSGMAHYARIIREQLGREVSVVPGAGAAGGLGAGLLAFLNATLVNGFSLVAETVALEEAIRDADLIITGEGRMDQQTMFGKTPFGVAQLAGKYGKPVIGVAGSVDEGANGLYRHGFNLILPIQEKPTDLAYALEHTGENLVRTGERIARMLALRL